MSFTQISAEELEKNGDVVVLITGEDQKRKVMRTFIDLMDDDEDIDTICEDLKEILRKLRLRERNRELHVGVVVWRLEKVARREAVA